MVPTNTNVFLQFMVTCGKADLRIIAAELSMTEKMRNYPQFSFWILVALSPLFSQSRKSRAQKKKTLLGHRP